jgi:hypothetical protein
VERKYDKRSEYLRNLLSIYDASPLKTRDPSNIFEHFGEILDDWYTESMHRNFLDMCVVDRDDLVQGSINYTRFFNSSTFTFRFRVRDMKLILCMRK